MNEKIIITEPSSSLRARGRNSLEGMWKTAVLGLLIYEAILNIPPLILDRIMGYPKYIPMFYGEQELTIDTSPLSGIYTFVITGIFFNRSGDVLYGHSQKKTGKPCGCV